MKLRIFMKKLQMYDEHQQPIWYTGQNPHSLSIVYGTLPNNEYREFTDYVDNLDDLVSTWRVRTTENNKSISNIEKSVTDELEFHGEAFKFIKQWLIDDVAAALNGIDVKIELENCGNMLDFMIKREGISYCTDDYCNVDVNLKQRDDFYTCVYSTLITDNHQNMFDGNYQHPRFSYCNEFRPTILLSLLFSAMGSVFAVMYTIVAIVDAILDIVDFITFGAFNLDEVIDAGAVKDGLLGVFVDMFGCGREHPAPLVRDYIRNVCEKCNIQVNADSFPIMFNPSSDYYNTCYLNAEVRKGVHRKNEDDYWIPDNDPLLTLDMLLDKLKKVFNAKWYIKAGTLYFKHIDELDDDEFLFDFMGADKDLVLDNICYTWNEIDKPAFMRVGYSVDAMDNLPTDCQRRYNDIVEFNKPINPTLKGEENRTLIDFAPTRFRNDGIERDYVSRILDPLELDDLGVFFGVLFSGPSMAAALLETKNKMKKFRNAILMQSHTTILPRLIIWDGKLKNGTKKAARAVSNYSYGGTLPSPNPRYNPDGIPYNEANSDDEQWDEFYDENNRIINYPMFFDAQYKGNLWDFHETDDPRFNPPLNNNFELAIPLCCENIQRLNLLDDAGNINIDRKVKIDGGAYYQEGIIREIELHFSSKSKLGAHIKIKGII